MLDSARQYSLLEGDGACSSFQTGAGVHRNKQGYWLGHTVMEMVTPIMNETGFVQINVVSYLLLL